MYASKRTIGKQGMFHAPASKNADKGIKDYSNRESKRGRKFFVQTITKKEPATHTNETLTKTIVHFTGHDMFNINRPRKRRQGYLKNSKKHKAN